MFKVGDRVLVTLRKTQDQSKFDYEIGLVVGADFKRSGLLNVYFDKFKACETIHSSDLSKINESVGTLRQPELQALSEVLRGVINGLYCYERFYNLTYKKEIKKLAKLQTAVKRARDNG